MNFYFARSGQVDDRCSIAMPRDDRFDRLSAAVAVGTGASFRVAVEGLGRGIATIRSCAGEAVKADFELISGSENVPEIDVLLALPRPKVLRRLIPRITAMGISSLTLLNACGVKREYFATHWLRDESIAELVMLGLEQGGACRYPAIRVEKQLKPFLMDGVAEMRGSAELLLASPDGSKSLPVSAGAGRVIVAIGPETGWTDFELGLFADVGFMSYRLCEEHLPCDVAAIAAVAVVKARLSGGL